MNGEDHTNKQGQINFFCVIDDVFGCDVGIGVVVVVVCQSGPCKGWKKHISRNELPK